MITKSFAKCFASANSYVESGHRFQSTNPLKSTAFMRSVRQIATRIEMITKIPESPVVSALKKYQSCIIARTICRSTRKNKYTMLQLSSEILTNLRVSIERLFLLLKRR